MAKQYTEKDLGILVAGDWGLVNSVGAEAKTGVGVMATQREQPGPWNYPREMVLTFPFTLNQFREFCDWHTYFQWEVIEARYLNDDGSLDEDALAELARRGEDAAELVRRYLTGETDAENEAGPPPTVDRAEAREAPPTGQQDAPERSSSEEDSGESRAGEVHPDALAKAIATEVVQQLRNPADVPVVPPTGQQDAPGGTGNSGAHEPRLAEKPQSNGAASDERPMKKEALIKRLQNEWPSIRIDFQEASRNGLKEEAHAGKHGQWHPTKVREWGVSNGKLKEVEPQDTLSGVWPGPSRRHRI